MKRKLKLRPITDKDKHFLHGLYATTREDEMKVVPWSEDEKTQFVKMQFEAQHTHYHRTYIGANFDIIRLNGKDIGRLYVHRKKDELRLMEITLAKKYRNQGIGTQIIEELIQEAKKKQVFMRLYVEQYNPAFQLYSRFGFKVVGENGVYKHMELAP